MLNKKTNSCQLKIINHHFLELVDQFLFPQENVELYYVETDSQFYIAKLSLSTRMLF